MKKCYNFEILWVSIFAFLLLIVVSLQPYNKESFVGKELDGENRNNYVCEKLMTRSNYLKDTVRKFTKEQKSIISKMEPGLSELYMETDTNKHLKSMCVIPDSKMDYFKINLEQDQAKGGQSKQCRATSKNGKIEVVMPYVSDVISGCALNFNEYASNPNEVGNILTNLFKISDEQLQETKERINQQKNVIQSEVKSLNTFKNILNTQQRKHDTERKLTDKKLSAFRPKLNAQKTKYYGTQQTNTVLKNNNTNNWV